MQESRTKMGGAEEMKLNAGCGGDIREGWVNADLMMATGVDVVIDLSKPLPFKDETFDRITCFSVLEHLWNWEETMMEFHRILRMGGTLEIKVPKGFRPSAYHVRFFELYSFSKFVAGLEECTCIQATGNAKFELTENRIRSLFPFAWHFRRYLGIKTPRYFIFGRKKEIHLKLTKIMR
ncbi:MAG: methyltransferase domain-containing protein [Thermoplasmata archaeon]